MPVKPDVASVGRPATVPPAQVPRSTLRSLPNWSSSDHRCSEFLSPSSSHSPCSFLLSPWLHLCRAPLPPLCTTGYCDIHCHSHRCHFHHPSSPAHSPSHHSFCTVRNPPRRPLQVCRAVGCPSLHTTAAQWASVPSTVQVEDATVAPLHPRCSHNADIPVVQSPLHPVVQFVFAISIAPVLVVWSMTLYPCLETARGRLADGRRHREPLFCRSLLWFGPVQLSSSLGARWGCARRVHGPRQLFNPARSPSSLCPRNTVPFDGNSTHRPAFPLRRPVGSHGRETGFLFHSSILSSPIPGVADLQSLRWRLVSGVICVCSFYALCRCPCGVLAHIGRFCTSCLTHPSRVTNVACLGTPMCGFPFSSLVGRDKLIPPLFPSLRR